MVSAALLTPASAAAETAKSVETWMQAGLGYELPLNFSVELGAQLKLDEDLTRVKSVLPQVELGYRATEWLKFSGGYRFIYERDKYGDFDYGHRVFFDGQTLLRVAKARFKYRLRFQDEWEWNRDGELRNRPTIRNMLGASYKVTKWFQPAVSAEHFLATEKLDSEPTRKCQITAGSQFDLGRTEFELFYRIEIQRDNAITNLTHIIGLGFFAEPWTD
ncbi:MAG: DUF2490 domain-containing protein [Myxococcota bacterium]